MWVKIIVFLFCGILLFSLYSWGSSLFIRQSVADKMIKDKEAEIAKTYTDQIKNKDAEIGTLTDRLTQSEKEYVNLKNQYFKLKKDYANVAKPKDVPETKRRLNDMGYPTR
jgi:predicted  nucleic acid-binding Zn-ribbon protein